MTIDGGDEDAIPARGSTPIRVIDTVRQLVMQAGVALRAIPRVMRIFVSPSDPEARIPSASGARWWLQRLGLFALRERLPIAADWVYLIDHSVQTGTVKVCVIVGLRLSEWLVPRPLRLEDLHLLAAIPIEHSTGDVVAAQLEEATKRTGIPRQVVSDHGSDVKKGSELFAAQHPQTAVTYDAAHHGAIVLKKRLEAHPRWAALITRLGQTKARILQTTDAYLSSPSLRSKARYMNLKPVLRWCRAILKLIARGAAGGVASERAIQRYGWLREYRGAIRAWSRWESTVSGCLEFVRTQGLSAGSDTQLERRLRERPSEQRDQRLESEMIEFVRQQSASARPAERLLGSTEILESVFGKWKTLERQESNSGITSLILSLGSMLGKWPSSRVREALEATPVKAVHSWCATSIPTSVQSQRRLAFAASSP